MAPLAQADAEPIEVPPAAEVQEDTGSVPVEEGQEQVDELKLKRLKLMLLLLMLTSLMMVVLLMILILSLRYHRYVFLPRKPKRPKEVVDVWWLASPKTGKPVTKDETPPDNA
jgi:hypothetical protein